VVQASFKGLCIYFTMTICFQCWSTFSIVGFISSVCATLTAHTKNIQLILSVAQSNDWVIDYVTKELRFDLHQGQHHD
jgi:hypothetical protein